MLRRLPAVSDRAIGIVLGVMLGLAIIIGFLFLGSQTTIDAPSISGGSAQTQTQPAPTPPAAKPKKPGK